MVPASGGVDSAELFALGRGIGPLSLFAAPTIVGRLVDEAQQQGLSPADCARSFKTIVYGGAPMYVADIQRALRVMGPRFVQIYGQGESPMTITALSRAQLAGRDHPRWAERMVSVGVAQSLVEVRVVDAAGQPLPTGETGEVVVRAQVVPEGEHMQVSLSVEDTGVGISAEDQRRLFSAFEQADASMSRKHGGSGLGLSICRSLVEAHGGRIQAEASPLGGLKIRVVLPLAPIPTPTR